VSGFKISPTLIEAENLIARGTMRGSVFAYDIVNAVGGQLMVANADTLASDMTALDTSPVVTKGDTTFAVNDMLVMRGVATTGIQEEWMRIVGSPAATYLFDTYNESNRTGETTIYNDVREFQGQAFLNNNEIVLDSCKFYLQKVGSPTGSAYAKLYACSGTAGVDAKPTGSALATSDAFDVSTLSTSLGLATFNFTGAERVTLSANTTYAIVYNYGGGDVSNQTKISYDGTPTHAGNLVYSVVGATWNSHAYDTIFYIYGVLPANTYAVTRDLVGSFAANTNPIWKAGTPVVKQGSSDGASTYSGGWLRLIGEGTNSPYYSVFQRNGVAYNAYVETCRLGNLNGFLGYSSDLYGIGIGETDKYLKYDPTNGLQIAGIVNAITVSTTGYVKGGQTAYATGTGFFLGYDTDAYKFSVGNNLDFFTWNGIKTTMSQGAVVDFFTDKVTKVGNANDLTYTDHSLSGSATFTKSYWLNILLSSNNNGGGDVCSDAVIDSSKDFAFGVTAKFSASGDSGCARFGLFDSLVGAASIGITADNASIVYDMSDSKLYFHTAASATVESTEITGITITNYNYYKVVKTSASVKCYVNGVLKATHTTRIPSNTTTNWLFSSYTGVSSDAITLTFYDNFTMTQAI
jgi:hypothetical protein